MGVWGDGGTSGLVGKDGVGHSRPGLVPGPFDLQLPGLLGTDEGLGEDEGDEDDGDSEQHGQHLDDVEEGRGQGLGGG